MVCSLPPDLDIALQEMAQSNALVVPAMGDFCPFSGNVCQCLETFLVVTWGGRQGCVMDPQYVGVRDAAKCPTLHTTSSHRTYLAQRANSA